MVEQNWMLFIPYQNKLYLFFFVYFHFVFLIICVTEVKPWNSVWSNTLAALGLKLIYKYTVLLNKHMQLWVSFLLNFVIKKI